MVIIEWLWSYGVWHFSWGRCPLPTCRHTRCGHAPGGFRSESWTIKDVVVNTLLYVPLGFFFKGERRGAATVVGFAAVLSLAAELSQLFSHSRFPATTDVVCNMIGASAGVFIARVTERSTTSPGEALKSAIRRCMA